MMHPLPSKRLAISQVVVLASVSDIQPKKSNFRYVTALKCGDVWPILGNIFIHVLHYE